MKWFTSVFLPSLEARYNQRNGKLWLTSKQVDVCRRYMEWSKTVRGAMCYTMGRKMYNVQIAPNGCAAFHILVDGWIVQNTDRVAAAAQ